MKFHLGSRSQEWICRIDRFLLGALFVYAALLKIRSPQDFADSIAAYQILPSPVINLLALGLPLLELVCGILVLSGFFLRVGALGILALLAVFTAAITLALLRGLPIDCGCFGAQSWLDSGPWTGLLRDLILLGASWFIYQQSLRHDHRFEAKETPSQH